MSDPLVMCRDCDWLGSASPTPLQAGEDAIWRCPNCGRLALRKLPTDLADAWRVRERALGEEAMLVIAEQACIDAHDNHWRYASEVKAQLAMVRRILHPEEAD